MAKLSTEREETRKRCGQLEKQLQDSVSGMRRELDSYSTLCGDIDRYEREMKERAEMKASHQAKSERLTKMREERAQMQEQLKADQEAKLRNDKIDADIQANLEYRERERAIVAHQKKVRQGSREQKEMRCEAVRVAHCALLDCVLCSD